MNKTIHNFKILFFLFLLSLVFLPIKVNANTKNDITITDWNFIKQGELVTVDNPLGHWLWYGIEVSYHVDNSSKVLKNNTIIEKEIKVVSNNLPSNVNLKIESASGEIRGNDGVTYGSFEFIRINNGGSKVRFRFNSNIEETTGFNAEFLKEQAFGPQNYTGDPTVIPLTMDFGGVQRLIGMRGTAFVEPLANQTPKSSSAGGNRKMENHFRLDDSRYRKVGHPTESSEEKLNARMSVLVEGGGHSRFYGPSLISSVYFPMTTNPNDFRVSTTSMADVSVLKYFTRVNPNQGETWADFEKRVWSKKYQYGTYNISSSIIGFAINAGDFTDKGWYNGTYTLDEAATNGLKDIIDKVIGPVVNQQQANHALKVYGKENGYKGAIPTIRVYWEPQYPDFDRIVTKKATQKIVYTTRSGQEKTKTSVQDNLRIYSTFYSINVPAANAGIKALDLDTSELLQNVKFSLYRKDGSSWVKQNGTFTTGSNGQTNASNLLPGTYRFQLDSAPSGYETRLKWSAENSSTTVTNPSTGEFVLENRGGASLTVELEKIKHQAVNFTVRDTANKIIPGEVFEIKRNGQFLAEYPTNNFGVFSIARLNAGDYSIVPTRTERAGIVNFMVNEGVAAPLTINAVFNVIPEITANGPSSLNLGNVNIGQVTRSTIPLDVTYRGDNGFVVTARQSNNTNVNFELNDTLITIKEKEFTNLEGTANPVTTMINYQLNAKTNSNSIKGQQSTNIIFSLKYKL